MRQKTTSMAAQRDHETPAHRLHLVGTTGRELYSNDFDEPETAHDQPESDNPEQQLLENDAQSEPELLAKEIDTSEDLVGVYLREMGVSPMLTREGEAALAVRIERGCRRTAKAVSRLPICIEEIIAIGDRLKRGELHIREVINFRDQEDITEAGIHQCLLSTNRFDSQNIRRVQARAKTAGANASRAEELKEASSLAPQACASASPGQPALPRARPYFDSP